MSLAEGILRYQVLVLVAERCVACPDIPTRSRRGDDDRARRLLVFGFEVLSDDAILLDGIARERIAAARVLTECSTVNPALTARKVVLQAGAVDEHVHLAWPLPTVREGLVGDAGIRGTQVGEVGGDRHARRERRQIQEIVTR